MTHITCCLRVSIADKHYEQKQIVYFSLCFTSEADRNHGGVLLTGLFLMAWSTSFLKPSRTTSLWMTWLTIIK